MLTEKAPPRRLDRGNGLSIAYHRLPGKSPGVVFLGGFMSDMTGSKATALEAWAAARGHAFLRFDYQGHGASDGRFEDGTIGLWAADALAALDGLTEGPHILVGSSMGGWIALLCARARAARVAALVGIAAAPDFTEDLIWRRLGDSDRETMMRVGVLHQPSAYADQPYAITRALIEDGRTHLLLGAPIAFDGPVRLLHGMRDPDVPWQRSTELADRLTAPDLRLILVKDGDHRLARPQDLALLTRTLDDLTAPPAG